MARILYADKISKEQAYYEGVTNRINISSDKSSSTLLVMHIAAIFISPEERALILENSSINPPAPPTPTEPTDVLISSKDNTTDGRFTVGEVIIKDMRNDYYYNAGSSDNKFNPYDYQNEFFPGMADVIEENIVQGDKASRDRLLASYWLDWGLDIFDGWGYFYLYDVNSRKYYFPLLTPQNQANGILTTQTFNAFNRTFTIKHGHPVQGIFKFDISVNDSLPFRFGAYGDMGSDGSEDIEDLTYSSRIGSNDLTLYYQRHA